MYSHYSIVLQSQDRDGWVGICEIRGVNYGASPPYEEQGGGKDISKTRHGHQAFVDLTGIRSIPLSSQSSLVRAGIGFDDDNDADNFKFAAVGIELMKGIQPNSVHITSEASRVNGAGYVVKLGDRLYYQLPLEGNSLESIKRIGNNDSKEIREGKEVNG